VTRELAEEIRLTPTSYLVLGFIEMSGESTPYELKQRLELSAGSFWSVPHSQLYAEPARLAAAGYLSERREKGGRRRRHYALTKKGGKALAGWRDEPTEVLPELRDLSLLKLFFGGDPRGLAQAQASTHERQLAAYEELQEADTGGGPRGIWLSLEAGIAHEREWVAFWRRLAAGG
jgi:PadR family transcriptional regulator, regulatory protein AphA